MRNRRVSFTRLKCKFAIPTTTFSRRKTPDGLRSLRAANGKGDQHDQAYTALVESHDTMRQVFGHDSKNEVFSSEVNRWIEGFTAGGVGGTGVCSLGPEYTTQQACLEAGGTWTSTVGGTCSLGPQYTSQEACIEAGGLWTSNLALGGNGAGGGTGVCSLGPEYTTPQACAEAGGTWTSTVTIGGTCSLGPQYTTQQACIEAGGTWTAGRVGNLEDEDDEEARRRRKKSRQPRKRWKPYLRRVILFRGFRNFFLLLANRRCRRSKL